VPDDLGRGSIDIDFLVEAGEDLPAYLSLVLEKLPPFDQAMIVVAYQRMARVAAEAAPLTGITQTIEFLGTLRDNVERATDPMVFSRELAFLLACLVALSDKYLRVGAASSHDACEVWRLLLSAVGEIGGSKLRYIWGSELGVFADQQTPEQMKDVALRFIVPPIYRRLMPEFGQLNGPCIDEGEFTHIIA
jgi:hypothetical protein